MANIGAPKRIVIIPKEEPAQPRRVEPASPRTEPAPEPVKTPQKVPVPA